jgi:mRNA interferase RelE/StbE
VSQSRDVQISARAERDIARLPEKIAAACVEFIFGPLAENPYRVGADLRGQLAGLRSARRGSYRVIYKMDEDQNRIDIVHIDHRGDVYRSPAG